MNNKNLLKAVLIFGGGLLLFMFLKPKPKETSEKKSADGSTDNKYPAATPENAEIVMMAYSDALKNGEPSARLTELNKEMMQEFGMRCYVDTKTNQLVVCDVKGDIVLTK